MAGNRIAIVTDHGADLIEVHPPSRGEVDLSGLTVKRCPPAPATREAFLQQEGAYVPDVNDGVRVNVAPLQKAGLLAGDVIAKKDEEKAIADRAEWRADERRWCREGKLPKCGWWS